MTRTFLRTLPLACVALLASAPYGQAGGDEFQDQTQLQRPAFGAPAASAGAVGDRTRMARPDELHAAGVELGAHQKAFVEPGGGIVVMGRTDNESGKTRATEGQKNLFAKANIQDEHGNAIVLPNAAGEGGNAAGQKLAGMLQGGAGHLIYTVKPSAAGEKPTIVVNSMRSYETVAAAPTARAEAPVAAGAPAAPAGGHDGEAAVPPGALNLNRGTIQLSGEQTNHLGNGSVVDVTVHMADGSAVKTEGVVRGKTSQVALKSSTDFAALRGGNPVRIDMQERMNDKKVTVAAAPDNRPPVSTAVTAPFMAADKNLAIPLTAAVPAGTQGPVTVQFRNAAGKPVGKPVTAQISAPAGANHESMLLVPAASIPKEGQLRFTVQGNAGGPAAGVQFHGATLQPVTNGAVTSATGMGQGVLHNSGLMLDTSNVLPVAPGTAVTVRLQSNTGAVDVPGKVAPDHSISFKWPASIKSSSVSSVKVSVEGAELFRGDVHPSVGDIRLTQGLR